MAANQILAFAQGGGANVLSQATYAADAQLLIGHQPGIARAQLANKLGLQTSAVAAGVAQFLADCQGTDITDQLTPASYSAIFKAALNSALVFTTQTAGDSSTKPATTAFVQAAVNGAVSAGQISYFPATSPPPGYLKANGALLSRATYANLWAYAQASGNLAPSDGSQSSGQFSPGDGATTFRIPDLRGYHVRSWDDARGVDGGRGLGSAQTDQFPSHSHGFSDPGHSHVVSDPGHAHNFTAANANVGGIAEAGGARNSGGNVLGTTAVSATYIGIGTAATNISIGATGTGTETRVKNIALLACIKY